MTMLLSDTDKATLAEFVSQNPDSPFSKYVSTLIGTMGINPAAIPMDKFEAVIETPTPDKVNPILFACLSNRETPTPTPMETAPTDLVSKYSVDEVVLQTNLGQLLTEARNNVDSYSRNMQAKYESYLIVANKCADYRRRVTEIERTIELGGDKARPLSEQITEIESGNWWRFVYRTGNDLYFLTGRVVLRHYNPAASIDRTVDMGQYVARVNVSNKNVDVFPAFNTRTMADGSYSYHPHVSGSGGLCWGDGEDRWFDSMYAGDLVGAMNMLRALLTTYEHSNPYQTLETYEQREIYKHTVTSRMPQHLKEAIMSAMPYCAYGHVEYVDFKSTLKQGEMMWRRYEGKRRFYIIVSKGNAGISMQRIFTLDSDDSMTINRYGTARCTEHYRDLEEGNTVYKKCEGVYSTEQMREWLDTYISRNNRNYETKINPDVFLKPVIVTCTNDDDGRLGVVRGFSMIYVNDKTFLAEDVAFSEDFGYAYETDKGVNYDKSELDDEERSDIDYKMQEFAESLEEAVTGVLYTPLNDSCSECGEDMEWLGDSTYADSTTTTFRNECPDCGFWNHY